MRLAHQSLIGHVSVSCLRDEVGLALMQLVQKHVLFLLTVESATFEAHYVTADDPCDRKDICDESARREDNYHRVELLDHFD